VTPSSNRLPSSPRRRLLVLAMVAAVVLVAGVVLVRVAVSHRAGSRAAVAQDVPGPVLLIPGYGGDARSFDVLLAALQARGRSARVVVLPGDGTGDLREQAKAVDAAVATMEATGAPSVDLVGYSAGGVVARLWARDYAGASRARRIVSLGSPQHGTQLAGLAAALVPGACPLACQQLAVGSDVLGSLNRGEETPAGPRWVSVWSGLDETVTPPETARLAGAVDVALQSVCADDAARHSDLPRDPLVVGLVLRATDVAEPTPVGPADCAALRGAAGG
jgi:triacylglycerol lipase